MIKTVQEQLNLLLKQFFFEKNKIKVDSLMQNHKEFINTTN